MSILALIIGVFLAFLTGWLWYGPKGFLKIWAEGSRIDPTPPESPPLGPMLLQLASITALGLMILYALNRDAPLLALLAILACAVWVASNGAWVKKSKQAILIDAGYTVTSGIILLIIQSIM